MMIETTFDISSVNNNHSVTLVVSSVINSHHAPTNSFTKQSPRGRVFATSRCHKNSMNLRYMQASITIKYSGDTLPRGKQKAAPITEPNATFLVRQQSDPGTRNTKQRRKNVKT